MKKSFLILVASAILLLSSCTTTNYVVSNSVNIKKYTYAVLNTKPMESNVVPALYGFEVELSNKLNSMGIKVISTDDVSELQDYERANTLILNIGYVLANEEVVISLNFIDETSGLLVATCSGSAKVTGGYAKGMKGISQSLQAQLETMFDKKLKKNTVSKAKTAPGNVADETAVADSEIEETEETLEDTESENTGTNEEIETVTEPDEIAE